MLKNPFFAITAVSVYLLAYLLIHFSPFNIALCMFLFSPFLIIWMVCTIVKYGKYSGPTLDNDEWGYEDRSKEDLDIF